MIILFSYLLLQFIYYVIKRPKVNILSCGLFCHIGSDKPDMLKLVILALYNQSRGDHATGLVINNKIYKDTIKASEFFAKKNEILSSFDNPLKNKTILGHCRASSVYNTRSYVSHAHPHESDDHDGNKVVLIHNGTISNADDLAKKYKITEGITKSDSKILTDILAAGWATKNFNVLKEFSGTATVVFYNTKNPEVVYVHKDPLRELFIYHESETNHYISSIKESLFAIGGNEETVFEFEDNRLYKYSNGVVKEVSEAYVKKTPYLHPRPKVVSHIHVSKHNPVKETKHRNGFYFDEEVHLYKHNGHIYTGTMFVHKTDKNKKPTQYPESAETKNQYNEYYIICGTVMKNKESYLELYKKFEKSESKTKEFDYDKFKKISSADLQDYALYPVLGKIFSANNLIFWHSELKTLKAVDSTYEWIPVLCSTKYKINRGGAYVGSEPLEEVHEPAVNNIEELIKDKISKGQKFQKLQTLHTVYNEKVEKVEYLKFLELFQTFLELCDHTEPRELNEISSLFRAGYNEYQNEPSYLYGYDLEVLEKLLLKVQDCYICELVANQGENSEVIPKDDLEDCFDTPGFRADVIFNEEFKTLETLTSEYVIDRANGKLKPFYAELGKILYELELLDYHERTTVITGTLKEAENILKVAYAKLKNNSGLKEIQEVLNSEVKVGKIAKLRLEVISLEEKPSLSIKEGIKLQLFKFGLNYLKEKLKDTEIKQLKDDYGVELEKSYVS